MTRVQRRDLFIAPLATLAGAVATMIAIGILARGVSVPELGRALAISSVALVVCDVVDAGLSRYVVIKGAARESFVREELPQVLTWRASESALVVLGAWLGWTVGAQLVGALLALVAVRISLQLVASVLQSRHQFGSIALCLCAEKAAVLASVAVLVHTDRASACGYVMSLALGATVSLILMVALVAGSGLLRLARPRRPWRGPFPMGVASVVSDAAILDIVVVTSVAGAQQAGILALPSRIVGPLGLATGAISSVLLPRFAGAASDREAFDAGRRVVGLWLSLCVTGAVVATAARDLVIEILGGDRYIQSSDVLAVYAWVVVLIAANLLAIAFLDSRGHARAVATATAAAAGGSLLLLAVGAAAAGALGAAVAVLFVNLTLAVWLGLRVRRLVGAP